MRGNPYLGHQKNRLETSCLWERFNTQLEMDAVPPGYPILLNFLPDLEAFYGGWLGRPVP